MSGPVSYVCLKNEIHHWAVITNCHLPCRVNEKKTSGVAEGRFLEETALTPQHECVAHSRDWFSATAALMSDQLPLYSQVTVACPLLCSLQSELDASADRSPPPLRRARPPSPVGPTRRIGRTPSERDVSLIATADGRFALPLRSPTSPLYSNHGAHSPSFLISRPISHQHVFFL